VVVSVRLSVFPFVRMCQQGSKRTYFCEIWCCELLLYSVERIQIRLKSDTNILHEDLIMFYCCYRKHSIARKALSWSEMLCGSWDCRAGTNITRTLNNVTLYVHCLFFSC